MILHKIIFYQYLSYYQKLYEKSNTKANKNMQKKNRLKGDNPKKYSRALQQYSFVYSFYRLIYCTIFYFI